MLPEPSTDPRVAKILTDLLALALSDNEPQGEAAIGAVRRRALRDGVTGGAVKALAARLLAQGYTGTSNLPVLVTNRDDDLNTLRWTVDDQLRELDQTRHARQLAEASLSDIRQTNFSLSDRIGRLNQARRTGRVLGFLAGLVCGLSVWAGVEAIRLHNREIHASHGIAGASGSLNETAAHALADKLRSCFLTSGNSLGGGTSFEMHILLDVQPNGTIDTIRPAPDQAAQDDPQKRQYAEMMLRTLNSGSCGSLPLPASLRGKADHLDLYLPP